MHSLIHPTTGFEDLDNVWQVTPGSMHIHNTYMCIYTFINSKYTKPHKTKHTRTTYTHINKHAYIPTHSYTNIHIPHSGGTWSFNTHYIHTYILVHIPHSGGTWSFMFISRALFFSAFQVRSGERGRG